MQLAEGVYEPNTVSITLRRGVPVTLPHLKSHHTLMTISQIPTFNLTSFLVLTIVGYLVGRQCNSRACFTYEKCNLPDGIQSWDLLHCKPPLYQQLKEISTNAISRCGQYNAQEDRYREFSLQNIELSCITFCSLFEESISQFAITQTFIFCMFVET